MPTPQPPAGRPSSVHPGSGVVPAVDQSEVCDERGCMAKLVAGDGAGEAVTRACVVAVSSRQAHPPLQARNAGSLRAPIISTAHTCLFCARRGNIHEPARLSEGGSESRPLASPTPLYQVPSKRPGPLPFPPTLNTRIRLPLGAPRRTAGRHPPPDCARPQAPLLFPPRTVHGPTHLLLSLAPCSLDTHMRFCTSRCTMAKLGPPPAPLTSLPLSLLAANRLRPRNATRWA